jgi:Uma2 family endonuclease
MGTEIQYNLIMRLENMYQQYSTESITNSLPTMYDLPSENPEEPGLPDEFHDVQPALLKETCRIEAEDFFIGKDLNLYYDVRHTNWYKRPDWFLVVGAPASTTITEARLSYVMWQEGVAPFLMVELLSPGTEAEDLGQTLQLVGKPPTKWQVYEQILRVPYYAIFDRYSNQFRVFGLQTGRYVEATVEGQGFWFEEINLGLGVWNGVYQGIEGQWIRWFDRNGNWIPTLQEEKLAAIQEIQLARQEADQERQKADRLAAKLRELGVEFD